MLVRDVGKIPFPPEPQSCEQDWTPEAAQQELSQQLYMLAYDGSSDGTPVMGVVAATQTFNVHARLCRVFA